jgi:hypothetical protein
MTSACLFDMNVDDKSDIQTINPSKKRVKIANSFNDSKESNHLNINLKKEEDLKRIFPFLSAELIEDILKKTSYNIEQASNMVHSLNTDNFSKNSNFVSVHQSNKKRRFNELDDCVMTSPKRNENNFNIPTKTSFLSNSNNAFTNNSNIITSQKIISSKKQLNIEVEADNIINVAKQTSSMSDLKIFIKSKILSYLSNEDKLKINETKNKLEKCISDNKELKHVLISIYKKYENTQIQIKEKESLQNEIEDLKQEIDLEKLKGKHLHNRLLQYDTSNRLNIEETRDIY